MTRQDFHEHHEFTVDDDDFNRTVNQTLMHYGLQETLQSISIGVLFMMSLVGNSLALRFIIGKKALHTSTFILIANNCAVDLAVTIFIMPICFIVSILRYWPLGDAACQFFGFIDMTLYTGSLMALAAISVIRCFVTVCIRDRNYHQKISNKTAYIMIFICWFYSLTWASFPLMGWNNYVFYLEKLMCNMNHLDEHHFTTASTMCTTLAPGLVVIFCSLRIIIAIRQHSQHNQFHQEQNSNRRSRMERKVTLTLFVVFIAYCTCTVPQVAVASLYKWGKAGNADQRARYINVRIMATIIYLSNCTVNPIIYGICNENLRDAFRICGLCNNYCRGNDHSHEPTSTQPVLVQVGSKQTSMNNNWIQRKFWNRSVLINMSPKLANKTTPVSAMTRMSEVSLASIEHVQTAM